MDEGNPYKSPNTDATTPHAGVPITQRVRMLSSSLIIDIVWPVAAGAIMAVAIIPISIAAFVVWLLFLIRRYRSQGRPSPILVQCGILGLVLAAAALAPVKTAQQFLARGVRLDATQMTLKQLDAYLGWPGNRQRVPVRILFSFAEKDKERSVQWPSEQMTLAEFVAGIESQTALRHSFMHCGNGWTLLWGGDCCSGLLIYDPELSGPLPKTRYERE